MANKKKVHIQKVYPYVLRECIELTGCLISDIPEYDKRIQEANQCRHRGDELTNKGWIGHFKMVKIVTERDDDK